VKSSAVKDMREVLNIDDRGDRSRRAFSVIRSSCLVLLFLLPLNAFAQAHLLKQRPFRATDTALSGGDHICNLRRDTSENGRPERLGDYVRVCGTVIAEPSTFETGGWLFWIRERACGVLIYGEQEHLALGDSVEVRGCLRATNGAYFFPETGLATLGDFAVENMGVTLRGRSADVEAVTVRARDFGEYPAAYGGNLITLRGLRIISSVRDANGDLFMEAAGGADPIIVYLDQDTGIAPPSDSNGCYTVTGIAVSMKTPRPFLCPAWCIAPRSEDDVTPGDCSSHTVETTWGGLKAGLAGRDGP